MAQRSGNAYVAGSLGELALAVDASGNYAPAQIAQASSTWIVSQTSAIDLLATPIAASAASVAWLYISMANTATPAGKFKILGSVDGNNYFALNLIETDLYGAGFTFSDVTPTDITVDGSVTVQLMAVLKNCPPYLTVFWDRNTGGAAAAINGTYFLRS